MTGVPEPLADESTRRAVASALAEVTSEDPRSVEPLGRGNRKRTTLVQFADRGPVVVQLCGEQYRLRAEAELLTRIRECTPVPVPPVLAAGATDGVAYLVTAYVPGADLHERFTRLDPKARRRVARAFGRHLAQLHEAFRFDGYGSIAVTDAGLAAESENWDEWLAEYGLAAVDRLPSEFDPIREALGELFAAGPPRETPQPRLFPWDFRPGNTVIADGQITAVLDWEAPMAAPPALSAAKAEYLVADWYVADPEPLRAAFLEGYETVRRYPAVSPIHRAAAIADSAVDSAGTVTNPGYPEAGREAAVAFHREALADLL